MPKVELTNMAMMQDKITGKVLVQKRLKNWKGLSFPGGHVYKRLGFFNMLCGQMQTYEMD